MERAESFIFFAILSICISWQHVTVTWKNDS
jgi:hypothetical protein